MASKVKVNTVETESGSTLTLGKSGDTVSLASGASQTGFGRTGTVNWDTTKKTASFTATNGDGFFVDTTSSAITMTLPASPSVGNIVAVSDYAGTFATNNLTIGRNGSNINGSASDYVVEKSNVSVQLIYVDATQGWRIVLTGSQSGDGLKDTFITATGGTVTTCGDDKIHTFTGPGTFSVSAVSCTASFNQVSYMIVAGGGGGGAGGGPAGGSGASSGGGGGGGFRELKNPNQAYTTSPLCGYATPGNRVTVEAQSYPITVGGGGTAPPGPGNAATGGNNSIFSTITSTGGGHGATRDASDGPALQNGGPGGSGGGGLRTSVGPNTVGSGNTPPTTPPQGNDGGSTTGGNTAGGGGGGATAAGSPISSPACGTDGGAGGAGATTLISGSSTAYAGGGGGGGSGDLPSGHCNSGGAGGTGGGGAGGGTGVAGSAGTTNRGGGGGGGGSNPGKAGAAGGSGIVIIRYKFQ